MGGTTSKSVQNVIFDDIFENINERTLICNSSAFNNVEFKINKIEGDVNIEGLNINQDSTISVSCLLEDQNISTMTDIITNAIAQNTKSESQAVLSAISNATTESKVELKNNINKSLRSVNKNQVTNLLKNTVNISIGEVSGDVAIRGTNITQTTKIMVNSILAASTLAKTITDVSQSVTQVTESKQKTLIDSLGSLFSGFFSMYGIIIAAILAIVFLFISGGGGKLLDSLPLEKLV